MPIQIRKPSRRLRALLAAAVLTGLAAHAHPASAEWALPKEAAPLGPPDLKQSITTRDIAPGITYAQILRGKPAPADFWTVSTGFYPTEAAAAADAAALSKASFTPRLDPSAGTHLNGKLLGYWLSTGTFDSEAAARKAAQDITAATTLKPVARNTSIAGHPTTGPWVINVLALAPGETAATLNVALPSHDNLGGGGETVTEAATRTNALAAMNGGFFTNINPFKAKLPSRSPLGATVVDGRLVAGANGFRPGVLIETAADGHPTVKLLARITTEINVSDTQGDITEITTIDRPILGTVVNCGSQAEGKFTAPAQDYVCTNLDDLVLYDSVYLHGTASNTQVDASYHGPTYELVISADGSVIGGHATLGSAPPAGGYVLQGLGRKVAWLEAHATPGTKLTVTEHLYAEGKEIPLTKGVSILECGPTLSAANLVTQATTEGFSPDVNGVDEGEGTGTILQNWYNGWFVARNPRSAIGVTPDGTILLVEIDGRQPTLSVGTSIPETAAVMKWLGATSALNLDGGGSSNMIVKGIQVGHPSDTTGERGVGSNLALLARP